MASNDFLKNDLEVLKDLDIESSYIKDDKFQTFYESFSKKNEKHYVNNMSRGEKYIPEISRILKKNNVPSVFLYMAMAESNFVLEAQSNRKALGLWQFMPGTASEMGLKKNKYIDERMDFIKSTEAAAKYLSKLHGVFGSWYLAALSYNCGDGRLTEGLTRATIDMYCRQNDCNNNPKIQRYKKTLKDYSSGRASYKDVNAIYQDVKTWNYKPGINDLLTDYKGSSGPYIPKESKNYIKKIISLAMMNNNGPANKFNNFGVVGSSSQLVRVEAGSGMMLKNIANLAGVTPEKLKQLNPHLKGSETSPSESGTQIYIPTAKLNQYNENKRNAKNNASDKIKDISIVKEVKTIKDDVENIESDYLKFYTIQKNDNLYRVAKEHGMTMEKVMQDNNMKTSKVKPGDKIVIKLK